MGTSTDTGNEQDKDEKDTNWYDDIRKLSEQARQHVTEISDQMEYVGPGPLVDEDVLDKYISGEYSVSLDYDTFEKISGLIEELKNDIMQIHEKLEAVARE